MALSADSATRLPWMNSFPLPTTDKLRSRLPSDIVPLQVAREWYGDLQSAMKSVPPTVSHLFVGDGYWRDLLSLSWDFRTIQGPQNITAFLQKTVVTSGFSLLALAEDALRAPALVHPLPDLSFLQFSFNFETSVGKGSGTCCLVNSDGDWKAYTMFTALYELNGFPENAGALRNSSMAHGDWAERRRVETDFADKDPTVLIIGGGHVGLEVAARLKAFDVSTLIVDRNPRVGDNWRNRYKTLSLHDPVWADHMPYMPFPSMWPLYPPASKLGDWLEGYAKALDLNVWTSSTVKSARWDASTRMWTLNVQRGGSARNMQVKHLVFATGWGGNIPKVPSIPDQNIFQGQVLHSTQYSTPDQYLGKKVVVVGACTSGHDICQDFADHGADITMFQRSPTVVVSMQAIAAVLLGRYREGSPIELSDHLGASFPLAVNSQIHQRRFPEEAATTDKHILDGLAKVGFRTHLGPGNTGVMPILYGRAGGYYLDIGAAQDIIDGKIKVKSGGSIERFTRSGLRFSDGSELAADLVIFATGYGNARDVAKGICGPEVLAKVGPVWGLNEEGEVHSVWRESGHEGLWFAIGHFTMARYFSKFLALRIKAEVEGLVQPGPKEKPRRLLHSHL